MAMETQHKEDMVDAYVLGALEDNEVRDIEAHLVGCPACRRLVDRARQTAAMLLTAPPLVAPPPDLRARIIDRIRAEAAVSPASLPTPPPIAARSRLSNWLRDLLGPKIDDPSMPILARLLEDPECVVWSVPGTEAAPAATARFVGNPRGREGVLIAAGLRPLPTDQAYQVWLIQDSQAPIPSDLFRINRDGSGRIVVRAPARLGAFATIAITPEPAGGSLAPTGAIVMAGSLAA